MFAAEIYSIGEGSPMAQLWETAATAACLPYG